MFVFTSDYVNTVVEHVTDTLINLIELLVQVTGGGFVWCVWRGVVWGLVIRN